MQVNKNNSDDNFSQVGVMIDVSRAKVLNMTSLKRFADAAAAFGYTYINLYLEDLLQLEQYPQYGYLRGAYSDEEIIEFVKYCDELGIEVFPAIQTLGHLEHFLRWDASAPLRDTAQVLNVLSPATIDFLTVLIKKCKKLFPSTKINIGMDEAFDLGQGSVLRGGNQLSQKQLYMQHLENVVTICKNCGYETIKIWSDMLFNIYSQTGGESLYTLDATTKVETISDDVEIIFWNYWTRESEQYEQVINTHRKFSNNVSVALGIHTWGLAFYNAEQINVTKAALSACHQQQIKDVLFTMWGDDGSIYNFDSALYGMYLTACTVYGQTPNSHFFMKVTGLSLADLKIVSNITQIGVNPLQIIWNDPITNIQLKTMTRQTLTGILKKCKKSRVKGSSEVLQIYNNYLACIENDIGLYLTDEITKEAIDTAIADLTTLFNAIEQCWLKEAKVNGIEEIQLRFLAKINRYQFLLDHKNNPDIKEIRKQIANDVTHVSQNYNSIAKATRFRW